MLRPATSEDLDSMLRWRNMDANREASNHSHVITPDEHREWWERTASDPSRQTLVLEISGRPCGVVSFFDLTPPDSPTEGAWGFYLDHEGLAGHGMQLVAWNVVMKEAVAHAFDVLGLDELHAEVLEHNTAVRSMNRRFRFVEGTPFEREVDGRRVRVIPVRLRRENRRGAARRPEEKQ